MAVLQFKFDESYDQQIMTLGGWIATEEEWKRLESRWQKRIDFENKKSRPDQQITRFHAAQMNSKKEEFANWDKDKCVKFTKKLIRLLAQRRMGALAVGCDMDALRDVFPKGDEKEMLRRTYVLTAKLLMIDLAHLMAAVFPGDTLLMVHDSGNWDVPLLEGYKLVLSDPDWPYSHLFGGILPMTGKISIGLQAADMIAYEVFKGLKAKTKDPEAAMRGAMQEMLSNEIPMRARWLTPEAARALYDIMKESGKYPDLDTKGVT